jgi:AcrR family transcriptional regulator
VARGAPRGRRPAGGPDTREAILSAARELFADLGFERTTIRAIAARAAVDPSLVYHYFGDKNGLLTEAIALPVDPVAVFAGLAEEPDLGRAVALRLMTVYETVPGALERGVGLLRAGLSHELAAQALRDLLGSTVLAQLAAVVAPDHRELRVALVGSQLGGLLLTRYVLRLPALATVPREIVAAEIGPALNHYLTGGVPVPPPAPPVPPGRSGAAG